MSNTNSITVYSATGGVGLTNSQVDANWNGITFALTGATLASGSLLPTPSGTGVPLLSLNPTLSSYSQFGNSGTATNNITIGVPSTPDGTFKISRGNIGATSADILTIDSSNNVKVSGYNVATLKDIQNSAPITAICGGTVLAMTATFTPTVTSLVNGLTVCVKAVGENPSAFVQFQADATTSAVISKGSLGYLLPGDIAGPNHWMILKYDSSAGYWILLNPALGVTTPSKYQYIDAYVSSNVLNLSLYPTSLDFRNTALTSGQPTTVNISSNLSLSVPAAASLGRIDGLKTRLAILALYNGTNVGLGVMNVTFNNFISESSLLTPVTLNSSSNSDNICYSTISGSCAVRIVGYIETIESIASSWQNSPSLIHGIGGASTLPATSSVKASIEFDGTTSASLSYSLTSGSLIITENSHTKTVGTIIQVSTVNTGTLAVNSYRVAVTSTNTYTCYNVSGSNTSGTLVINIAIRSAYNITSIIKSATGSYQLNFINNLLDGNYTINGSVGSTTNAFPYLSVKQSVAPVNNSATVQVSNGAGTAADANRISVAIIGQ